MEQQKERRLTRDQVPTSLKWKLEDLFSSDGSWEEELTSILDSIDSVTQYQGKLGDGAAVLLACLKAEEVLYERLIKVATFAHLRVAEDGTNPSNQGIAGKNASAMAKISGAFTFIESELLDLEDGVVWQYLEEEKDLVPFRKHLLDILSKKPHRLSPETEAVLASLGEVLSAPFMIYQRTKSSDMQFDSIEDQGEEKPMSFALFEDRYELSANTELRRSAYQSFGKTLKQYTNTFAATYATEIKKQVVTAGLRKYESVTHMLLEPQEVTIEMYHNLLDIIQAELAPHMRRLAKLKQREFGLDQMLFCDLKAPLDPEYNPQTTYADASKEILTALQILGPEYHEFMEKGLSQRWVDLADNVGKSTGAFCASPYGVHPFILVTWTDTMRGAFILAHELGHAGHFSMASRYQRLTNLRCSLYCVEAPSTMNELLFGQYVLAKSDDPRLKRWVIQQSLGTYYHNYVTHLLEAEFQRRVYAQAEAGKPLTASVFSQLKGEVLGDFWGDAVVIDEVAQMTWMRQPHYYMGLYPYTYSAGLTAATACAQLFQAEGQPAVDRWLEMLKSGGTLKPLDLFKVAGVDMSTPDPIRKAVAHVGSLVDRLERSFV